MNRKEIAKQYKIKIVNVEPMLEDMVRQFRNDKHSLDIQQLRLITEYLIEDREFNANYIDETEQELEQEKEMNEKLLDGDFTTVYIMGFADGEERWKDKIKEKIKQAEQKADDDNLEEYSKISAWKELLEEK